MKVMSRHMTMCLFSSLLCTSMSKWYGAVAGVLCSLLASFSKTTNTTPDSAPWHLLVKQWTDRANVPTCSLCSRFLVVFKRHYWLRLARLKLTLGSCSFSRCWNVSLLRLRTFAWWHVYELQFGDIYLTRYVPRSSCYIAKVVLF